MSEKKKLWEIKQFSSSPGEYHLVRITDEELVATTYDKTVAEGIAGLVNNDTVVVPDGSRKKIAELMDAYLDKTDDVMVRSCDIVGMAIDFFHKALVLNGGKQDETK